VNFVQAFKPFLHLLRDLQTSELSIVNLGHVRQMMIDEGKCNRSTINGKMRRIRQCIRWGVEQRLVPGSVWHEVSAMRGLPIGRAGVRESKVVEAVPWTMVEPVLEHLPSPLRAAVLLQWWTGMRPSEVLAIRTCDLDRSGEVWVFRPARHKGQWCGKERVVPIGR
jgi:integrase